MGAFHWANETVDEVDKVIKRLGSEDYLKRRIAVTGELPHEAKRAVARLKEHVLDTKISLAPDQRPFIAQGRSCSHGVYDFVKNTASKENLTSFNRSIDWQISFAEYQLDERVDVTYDEKVEIRKDIKDELEFDVTVWNRASGAKGKYVNLSSSRCN